MPALDQQSLCREHATLDYVSGKLIEPEKESPRRKAREGRIPSETAVLVVADCKPLCSSGERDQTCEWFNIVI